MILRQGPDSGMAFRPARAPEWLRFARTLCATLGLLPVLMGAVKALGLLIAGDPMRQLQSWTLLLAGFAVIYWSLCGILFPYAIEEGL